MLKPLWRVLLEGCYIVLYNVGLMVWSFICLSLLSSVPVNISHEWHKGYLTHPKAEWKSVPIGPVVTIKLSQIFFTWIVFGNFFCVTLMMLNNNSKQSNEYQIITYCQNNHLWLPADTKTMIRWLAVILRMSVIYVHFKVPNIIFLWRIYYFWLIESSKHHINLYHLF